MKGSANTFPRQWRSRRNQNKAQPGCKFLSLHVVSSNFLFLDLRGGIFFSPAAAPGAPSSLSVQLLDRGLAAICSASFLLLPSPAPTGAPFNSTSTAKTLAWSGPLSPVSR